MFCSQYQFFHRNFTLENILEKHYQSKQGFKVIINAKFDIIIVITLFSTDQGAQTSLSNESAIVSKFSNKIKGELIYLISVFP